VKINFNLNLDHLTSYQKKLFDSKARFVYVEGSAQSGKTTVFILWIILQALKSKEGSNHFWITPSYNIASKVFKKIVLLIKKSNMEQFCNIKLQDYSIEFKGAGTIYAISSDRISSFIGITLETAVADECALFKEDSFAVLLSRFAASGGKLRALSNVHGKSNFFYKKCREAEEGKLQDTEYYRVTCEDAIREGITTRENIDQLRVQYLPARFMELFYCVAAEDNNSCFDYLKIKNTKVETLNSLDPVIFGYDLASRKDFACCIGLNIYGEVCYFTRYKSSWTVTKEKIRQLSKSYPDNYIIIDSTGVGDPIVEELSLELFNIKGYGFTNKSKEQLILSLSNWIDSKKLKIYSDYFPAIEEELQHFKYEYTRLNTIYNGEQGYHDDTVVALALATYHFDKYCRDSDKSLIAF